MSYCLINGQLGQPVGTALKELWTDPLEDMIDSATAPVIGYLLYLNFYNP